MTSYVTAQDIVIPAGTDVAKLLGGFVQRHYGDEASILIAVTKDHTAEWKMPLDEALEVGLVVAVD